MTETVHLLHLLNYRTMEETDDHVVMEMNNRPDLVNVRGALQGGLGKRLIVTSVDVIDVARDRLAARATLSFAVLDRR